MPDYMMPEDLRKMREDKNGMCNHWNPVCDRQSAIENCWNLVVDQCTSDENRITLTARHFNRQDAKAQGFNRR
jgi:hypothetical protein